MKETTKLTNAEIRESGVMPEIIRAMEHNPLETPGLDPVKAYGAIEKGVVETYRTIEQGVVEAYRKVEDTMVDKLFRREGETIEETKDRLKNN